MTKNRGFAPVLWVLVAILLVSTAFAQETTAGIQGTVKDPQGLAVSKAVVEVSGPALIGTKKVETDATGFYRFANLPPGEYILTTTAPNFRTSKKTGLKLEVGKMPTLDLKLEVGTVEQTVEVSGDAPIVDVTSTKVATTVTKEMLDAIPKGRSFQSVIAFAPGARQEPLQSTNRGSNGIGGFSVEGATDGENSYLVEGMDTTDIYAGGVGKNVPFEFVQEVQVKSSSFEAEFGGALGGVVNVIQKRGSNAWHGSAFSYFRLDALNANDQCGNQTVLISINCGLRYTPGQAVNTAARTAPTTQYYIAKKDHQRIIEPGFELGGFLKKDRLWLFTSYVPSFDRMSRTVNFTFPGKAGPRELSRREDNHNALTRLDWLATNKIRTYAAWQYGYRRRSGITLPTPDSAIGQLNPNAVSTAAATLGQPGGLDPDQFRQDTGDVTPNSVYNFGGDITLTEKLIVTARYGYWFSNLSQRGLPQGIRYQYQNAATGIATLSGSALPAAYQQANGFQNMTSNSTQLFDSFKRNSFSTDASYFMKGFGAHNFKFGYANNKIKNSIAASYNTAFVELFYGQTYTPLTPGICNPIIATNVTNYGAGAAGKCQGDYGYYTVSDFGNQGDVSSNNHALYFQDAWTVGHGVTVNAGVRFDKEYLPPYVANAPDISFGFGDKIAPRLGAAWDVMQNGKLKIYGSYGQFYDIMKYSLPRGSFGGDYWHDCTYTIDNPNYTAILPANVGGRSCPVTGGAAGTLPGRFIENTNFRSVTLSTTDPGVDPNLKPMKQHEYVIGADYAFNSTLGLEMRYSRKRLDRTIEDVGIAVPGNELYYIGNPGEGISKNLLQRPVTDSSSSPETTYPIACATCPLSPKAIRNYDGVEFRLIKKPSEKWFGTVTYSYSRLRGNYSGLTSSDVADASSANVAAGGGRHNPNVSRAFDMPFMQFDAHGKPIDGPLATDRPHTLKIFGYYRLKYFGHETLVGASQLAYSGTPLSTCMPLISTASSCQYVEGRGKVVDYTRAANGDLVPGSIHDARTPVFTQTDLFLTHDFRPSKTNEALRLGFEANVTNLFNQRAVLSTWLNPIASNAILSPQAGGTFNYLGLTKTGWNYTQEANTPTSGSPKVLDSRYGLPNLFQSSRAMRLKLKITF